MSARHISIAESNPDVAQIVSDVARLCGYQPLHFMDLQDLIDCLHPEAESLVLLGDCCPGHGAAVALKRILRQAPFAKVVVLGLESKPMELVRTIVAGAADALEFPFTVDRFRTVLQEAKSYLPIQLLASTAPDSSCDAPTLLSDALTKHEHFSQGISIKQFED